MNDTIFNDHNKVVFSDDPSVVQRRLKAKYPENWSRVYVGETGSVVTIPEYLYEEKYTEVRKMLEELLRRQGLPAFKRHPERISIYLDSTAQKIIEAVLGD